MLKIVALVGVLITFSGCATDGGMPNATAPTAGTVTWVFHDTMESLAEAHRTGGGVLAAGHRLGGFARWLGTLSSGGVCEIHTLYPGGYGTNERFGEVAAHEFRHCVDGRFHE